MTDMDGVLVHEGRMIPGADAFLARLRETDRPFLVLTNNSIYTPRDLQFRLRHSGLDVPVESIWTSALATASFLADQRPQGSAYVIGEAGLTTALHVTSAIGAVTSIGMAIAVAVYLRAPRTDCQDSCADGCDAEPVLAA